MKITIVVGNRPQFIKAAAFYRQEKWDNLDISLIHTGQHYDDNMSTIFFQEMDLPNPNHYLGIGGGNHGEMTGRMLQSIEKLFQQEKPDVVVVLGDTNSTLAGTLAAVKLHIPVAHVEAGLRSFNRKMPEEINRVLSDHASEYLFIPCEGARENLRKEGIAEAKIHHSGDVMYDVFLHYRSRARDTSAILQRIGLTARQYALATIHRAENTDDLNQLQNIIHGLSIISLELPIVFPLHPRTRKVLKEANLLKDVDCENLIFIDPVGYFDMIVLEENAKAIFTDSGGVQKEAYFCGVPCITLRKETEWMELVDNGFNQLVPPHRENIVAAYKESGREINWDINLYGNGRAAENILQTLAR